MYCSEACKAAFDSDIRPPEGYSSWGAWSKATGSCVNCGDEVEVEGGDDVLGIAAQLLAGKMACDGIAGEADVERCVALAEMLVTRVNNS